MPESKHGTSTSNVNLDGSKKRIVITGGAGYIGSILSQLAAEKGYAVDVIDIFQFGRPTFPKSSNITLVAKDVRDITNEDLSGAFAVLDLCAISNDSAGAISPRLTKEINYLARKRVQDLCRENHVERYVLASSCSVYGEQPGTVSEQSVPNPLTAYAEANLLAEESAFEGPESDTSFTALRQATVFGLSPRMRFDLVANAMALGAQKENALRVLRDGSQWRPLVHVRDTAAAFLKVLEASALQVKGQVFNVGSNELNFQIIQIVQTIQRVLKSQEVEIDWYGDPDRRSYKVDFSKIQNALGFETYWTLEAGIQEIVDALNDGRLTSKPENYTLDWYRSTGFLKSPLYGLED